MARKKREVSEIGIYHIMLRGENLLFLRDNDYETFLAILKEKTVSKNVKVLAYSLSENRVHIVLDVKDENVGIVLKPICTSYARYCNRIREISGKLFYDRFKSEPVNSKDELLDVVSFVNFIAQGHKNGEFSSLKNPVLSAKECGITEKQAKNTEFTRLFIEDYESLSEAELEKYIYAACGVTKKEFRSLSTEKQAETVDKITKDRRLLKSKIYEITGVKKPQSLKPKKTEDSVKSKPKKAKEPVKSKPEKKDGYTKSKKEKTEDSAKPKQEKKDMSVWLL